METLNITWSYNEFKAYVLIYAAESNQIITEEEKNFIEAQFDTLIIKTIQQEIKEDNNFALYHDRKTGIGLKEKVLKKFLKKKNFKNFQLIKGNIEQTIPKFLKKNKKLKISFLHLDLDVYKPTSFALEKLYKKVSKNGIILIDDYGQLKGATKATKNFLKKNKKLKIQRLSFNKRLYFIEKK